MTSNLDQRLTHTIKPGTTIPSNETVTIRGGLVVFLGTLTVQEGARLIFENCILDTTALEQDSVAFDLFECQLEMQHCQFLKTPKSNDPFQKIVSSVRTNGLCHVEAHHTHFNQTWNFATQHTDHDCSLTFHHCTMTGGYDIFVADCYASFEHCIIENHRNCFAAFMIEMTMSYCLLSYTGGLLEATSMSLSYSNMGTANFYQCHFTGLRAFENFAGVARNCTFTDLGYIDCNRGGIHDNMSPPSQFMGCQFIFTHHIGKFIPWMRHPSLVLSCSFLAQDENPIQVRFGLIQASVERFNTHIESCRFYGFDTQTSFVILPGTFYQNDYGMATVDSCQFSHILNEHGQAVQTHANSHDPVHFEANAHVIHVSNSNING